MINNALYRCCPAITTGIVCCEVTSIKSIDWWHQAYSRWTPWQRHRKRRYSRWNEGFISWCELWAPGQVTASQRIARQRASLSNLMTQLKITLLANIHHCHHPYFCWFVVTDWKPIPVCLNFPRTVSFRESTVVVKTSTKLSFQNIFVLKTSEPNIVSQNILSVSACMLSLSCEPPSLAQQQFQVYTKSVILARRTRSYFENQLSLWPMTCRFFITVVNIRNKFRLEQKSHGHYELRRKDNYKVFTKPVAERDSSSRSPDRCSWTPDYGLFTVEELRSPMWPDNSYAVTADYKKGPSLSWGSLRQFV